MAPVRVPLAVGVKVTVMVQLALAARLDVQVVVFPKSPLGTMLVIVIVELPVFVMVTVCPELVVPTSCPVNVSDELSNEALAPMPVPVSEMVCGDPVAESVMVTVPVRVPGTVGVKVTLIVQDPLFAATDVPQLLVCAKSPLATMLVIESDAVPVFVSVTPWLELVVLTF